MIAVVHLVWGPLGVAPLRRFLDSYLAHQAGTDHELVLVLNGVTSAGRDELLAELDGIEHCLLELEEPVQDLMAYARSTTSLDHERVCFLNSYSEILVPNWLAKLSRALDRSGVGLVGPSGSWASLRSWQLNLLLLPTPYRGIVPNRKRAFELFQSLERELEQAGEPQAQTEPAPRASPLGSMRARWLASWSMIEQLARFRGFPAVHLRTNAFMLERAVFGQLKLGSLKKKMDAYGLESGRNSITRQIQDMGLRPQVVDRQGSCFQPEAWPQSHTFWQGDQEQLLIADKQTYAYANGDFDRRQLLSALAWGPESNPARPSARVR